MKRKTVRFFFFGRESNRRETFFLPRWCRLFQFDPRGAAAIHEMTYVEHLNTASTAHKCRHKYKHKHRHNRLGAEKTTQVNISNVNTQSIG